MKRTSKLCWRRIKRKNKKRPGVATFGRRFDSNARKVLEFPSTSDEGAGKGKGTAVPSESEVEEEEEEPYEAPDPDAHTHDYDEYGECKICGAIQYKSCLWFELYGGEP